MAKLSIVIPVFNVESYLERCVESCENQDVPRDLYELILVNDGSTDGSLNLAEELAGYYSNIKVFSKPNGGLSSARNYGLRNASGEYIFYLDSDDWVTNGSLSNIIESIECGKDIIAISYNLAYEKGDLEPHIQKDYLCPKDALKDSSFPMGAPFWIVKKTFAETNDLFFTEGIYHEDNEYTPRLLYLAKSIDVIKVPIYNYFIRTGGSIISNKNLKKSYDLLGIISMYFSFMKKHVDSRDFPLFYDYCMLAFNSCCANAREHSRKDKEELMEYMLEKKDILDFSLFIKANTIKYKLESLCALVNRRLLYRIMLKL